ncbi:MAG TPA: quinone oxidoreductase [Kofleriaceae bacterium]|jgi:NADPH2:quinone reductase
MRAIQIDRTGGPEVLRVVDVPIGEPGPGEVRVRHHAIGVNFVDTYFRTGHYPLKLPAILGGEAAGVVEAVGAGVTHVREGDRVAYAAMSQGSYAEARVLPALVVEKLPDAISFETAAAAMLKGLTVQYLLFRSRAELHAGDAILWHAAAGGVGQIGCQWAASLGLTVIATAGSPEKCALALQCGATHAIDYQREDVVARVRELTGGRGVSVVFDGVGKDTFERSLDSLAPLGLLLSFGSASGAVPPVNIGVLAGKGSLFVSRPTLGTHLRERATIAAMCADLFAVITSGKVKIAAPRSYPLDAAAEAQRSLESRATTGSTILIP